MLSAEPTAPPRGTVVLVPGFTGSKEDFLDVLEPIADGGFHVIALDQRGQFETPHGDEEVSLGTLADDLLTFISTASPNAPAHVVGHSFGGLVVRSALLRDASGFASLSLLCSGPGALPQDQRALLDMLIASLDQFSLEQIWQAREAMDQAAGTPQPPPEVHDFMRRRFLANSPRAVAAKAQVLCSEPDRSTELGAALAAASVPALVVTGRDDDAWPVESQAAMAVTIGARWEVIEGAGHSPAVDQPQATARAHLDFWGQV